MRNPHPAGQPAPVPLNVVRTGNGGEIHRTPAGAVREVRTPGGAVIHYAPDGQRRMEVARPDGRTLFAAGGGRVGYVQRPFVVRNQAFVQRTYVVRGMATTRVYRPCVYYGTTFEVYAPVRYYRPGFYLWVYRPWSRPVSYRWGWAGRPWYGYYRGYWAPYPVYAGPCFWITDFLLASTLEVAYETRVDDNLAAPPPPPEPLSPEVKQAIADEVRRQIDQERAEQLTAAQGGLPAAESAPPMFSGNVSRIFLVNGSTAAYAGGREVTLSEGDVLQLRGAPVPGATYADVVVLASRTGACPKGTVVSVSLQDLQEMDNHMRATIDQGLGDLQSHQGQDGLPSLSSQTLGSSPAPYATGVQADPNAAAELSQAAQEAGSAGQQVLGQGAPAPTRSIALGMTVAEVQGLLGAPRETANVGGRRIDVFQNFRVTYTNGVVTDIQ